MKTIKTISTLSMAALLLTGSIGAISPTTVDITSSTVDKQVLNTQNASKGAVDDQTNLATQKQLADEQIMSLLWMRSAAEYKALCYQAYNTAMTQVNYALTMRKPADKPLAIVLDCDETVVDNTQALGQAAADGNGQYVGLWWRNTVHEGKSLAMPGASEFLNSVQKKGVQVFYVSNRYEPYNYEATVSNLKALGFPSVDKEHVLLMTDTGNKQPRYDAIASKYNVVVYMGDNLGDFPLPPTKTLVDRDSVTKANELKWGTKYIVFPNPVYGSWVSAIAKDYLTMTPEARKLVNQQMLRK